MTKSNDISGLDRSLPSYNRVRIDAYSLSSDLLPVCDVACLLAAIGISVYIYSLWFTPTFSTGHPVYVSVLVSSLLAPFFLYDQRFGFIAVSRHFIPMLGPYLLRFALFVAVVLALLLALIKQTGQVIPYGWLVTWLSLSLLLTMSVRLVSCYKFKNVKASQREASATSNNGLFKS